VWTFGRRSEEAEAAPAGPDRRGGVGLKRLCQQLVVNVPEVGGGFEVATYQSLSAKLGGQPFFKVVVVAADDAQATARPAGEPSAGEEHAGDRGGQRPGQVDPAIGPVDA
jgi:hypothetical protein